MSSVTYRSYQESDAARVKELIDEAFHVSLYTGGSGSLRNSALEVYLRQVLTNSTYSQVAVLDGRVVGVVTGRVKGESYLPSRATNLLKLWSHMARLLVTGWPHRKSLVQYFKFDFAYKSLLRDAIAKNGPVGDELTVFAVDAATRGTGVGKHLYHDYLNHLRQAGRNDFYLYTDTLCTYGFYEKQGMKRAASTDIRLDIPTLPSNVGVYLYTGKATA